MNIIDALQGEHAAVKGLLKHMESDPGNDSLLDLALDLLGSHDKIEEELIWKGEAKKAQTPEKNQEMIDEHKMIKEAMLKMKAASVITLRKIRFKEFLEILTHHLRDEEANVFPHIVGAVEPELLDKLQKRWAKFRKVGNK